MVLIETDISLCQKILLSNLFLNIILYVDKFLSQDKLTDIKRKNVEKKKILKGKKRSV